MLNFKRDLLNYSFIKLHFYFYALLFPLILPAKNIVFTQLDSVKEHSGVYLMVLGNVQDAGSPQLLCQKECCRGLFQHTDPERKVVSLGLVDFNRQKQYLFDATPDFVSQVALLNRFAGQYKVPDAIFLTHAHIGHYPGLMYLGKEALNAKNVPVYAMPRMKGFLQKNGPWSQLVAIQNIKLHDLHNRIPVKLSPGVSVTPIRVPHRDEYSETVGFIIAGPHKKALFIPDIDKWTKWDQDIVKAIANIDYAFLDATFFDGNEVNNRDISQIPHPFVIESLKRFEKMTPKEKQKVYFIHLNHTNPLLDPDKDQTHKVLQLGFHIARLGQRFEL